MAQARRRTTETPPLEWLVDGRRWWGYGRTVGFGLAGLTAFYLLVILLSFDPRDPAWTHTGAWEHTANWGGAWGAWIADILRYFWGAMALALPVIVLWGGWQLFIAEGLQGFDAEAVILKTLGLLTALMATCGVLYLQLGPVQGVALGGLVGQLVGPLAAVGLGHVGAKFFLLLLALVGLHLATGLALLEVVDGVGRLGYAVGDALGRGLVGDAKPQRGQNRPVAPSLGVSVEAEKGAAGPGDAQGDGALEEDLEADGLDPPLALEPEGVAPADPDALSSPQARVTDDRGGDDRGGDDRGGDDRGGDDRGGDEASRDAVPAPAWREPQRPPVLPGGDPAGALPALNLLEPVPQDYKGYSPETLEAMSRRVETLLASFGIKVAVVAVDPGPVITRLEIDPAPGVKVSQISNLAKDLARGLSVISVRVVEVVPGKSVVGLEVPNHHRETVYLSEILASEVYQTAASPLTLALGKDIGGRPMTVDLTRMPHLLVAGTTGSGKSVSINAMLLSILYKAPPHRVRLILVDPKMLELSVYEGIPHLLAPVVTDMNDAANALRWCVAEMERRYQLMAALKVRNIAGYNRKVNEAIAAGAPLVDPRYDPSQHLGVGAPPTLEPLPFVVVVIDELADMMMVVGKKVEELIARLAQKARAAGIHLILATQRPSVDVITGLIKANIPTRIAFQVSSKTDSRTILDQMGAETLLGHGDMLYLPPGIGVPRRIHGAFVDDHEVNAVAEYLKTLGAPDYVDGILEEPDAEAGTFAPAPGESPVGAGEDDPLYDQAVRIVTESRRASVSHVQRRLKIGYNRAARLIEEMERLGLVGALQPNGSREVLAPPPPHVDD